MKCNQVNLEKIGVVGSVESVVGQNGNKTMSEPSSQLSNKNGGNNNNNNNKQRTVVGSVSYDSYRTDSGYNSCSATSITSSSKCEDDEYDHHHHPLRTSSSPSSSSTNRIVSMTNKLTDSGISVGSSMLSSSSSSSSSSSCYSLQETNTVERFASGSSSPLPSGNHIRYESDSGLGLDERFSRLSVESSNNLTNCNNTSSGSTLDNGLLDKLESYNVYNFDGDEEEEDENGVRSPTSLNERPNETETMTMSELDVLVQRQKLIEEAFHSDKDGDTHLHLAIVHGRYDIINTLIQLAPEPSYLDLQNNLFQCPLHLAVLMGLPKVVRRLLLAGASLDVRNKMGNTPLHLACEKGDVECVRELLRPASLMEIDYLRVRRRAWGPPSQRSPVNLMAAAAAVPQDLELRNYEGQMCVHLAAVGQHVQVIGLLKQYGANMNSGEGKSGRTALWYAIEARNLELVSFLVRECEASINAPTYAGITPFQLAYAQGTNLANGLLNLGAYPTVPVLSDSDSDYSSIDDEESMDTDMADDVSSSNYFDLKINGEPLW